MFDPWGSNYQARAKVSCGKETWSSVHRVLTPLSNLGNNTLFLAIPDLVSITAPGESPWWGWVHCWLWAGTRRECYCANVNRILVTRRLLSTFSKISWLQRGSSAFSHTANWFSTNLWHMCPTFTVMTSRFTKQTKYFFKSSPPPPWYFWSSMGGPVSLGGWDHTTAFLLYHPCPCRTRC